jgi:hypothetical protein
MRESHYATPPLQMIHLARVVFVLLQVPNAGTPLQRAHELVLQLDLEEARKMLDVALSAGGQEPTALAKLLAESAVVAALMGDAAKAQEAYAQALAIDPGTAPGSNHPSVVTAFRAAREKTGGRIIEATVQTSRGEGQLRTEVLVRDDVLNLVAAARLHMRLAPPVDATTSVAGQFLVDWRCAKEPCEHWVQLLDRSSNILFQAGSSAHPLEARGMAFAPTPALTATKSTPRWQPWVAALSGIALAGAGAGFVALATQSSQQVRDYDANRSSVTLAQARGAGDAVVSRSIISGAFFAGAAACGVWFAVSF